MDKTKISRRKNWFL